MKTNLMSIVVLLGILILTSNANAISLDDARCDEPTVTVKLTANWWEEQTHQDLYVKVQAINGTWTLSHPITASSPLSFPYMFDFSGTPISGFQSITVFTPQTSFGTMNCN